MSEPFELTLKAGDPLEAKPDNAVSFPSLIMREGEGAARAYLNFFTAEIENDNTRAAYVRAVNSFMAWCEARNVTLKQVEPWMVATYIKAHPGKPSTVKQHLAAIRRLFDYLIYRANHGEQPGQPGPRTQILGHRQYLENGGSLETAQLIAAHSDPRTTKLYDRPGSKVQRSEIERIRFEPGGDANLA